MPAVGMLDAQVLRRAIQPVNRRGRFQGQRQKWFAMRFTGQDSDIDLATAHPEFKAWKWVESDELPRLIVPFKRQVYLDVLEAFRGLLER